MALSAVKLLFCINFGNIKFNNFSQNSIKDKLMPSFHTVAKLTVSVMVLASFSSALQLLKNGGRDEAMDEAKELIINSSPKHPEVEV